MTEDARPTRAQPRSWRRIARPVLTVLAALAVLAALVLPDDLARLAPGAFLRIPVEALVGTALMLVLPARYRKGTAIGLGVALALLAVLKVFDMGFVSILDRPFEPLVDWPLLGNALDFVRESFGAAGAAGAVLVALLLAAAVLTAVPLAVLRLARLVVAHRTAATRGVCAVLGVQLVPDLPVADRGTATLGLQRTVQMAQDFRDREEFAAQASVDRFRDTPDDQLLTGLRGKNVMFVFVESYGRIAIDDPQLGPQLAPILSDGNKQLNAAGFAARSGWLTSPTFGGGSWLAHSTLLSGLWITNQQRYQSLIKSNRLTLSSAFRRADWHTAAVMPATNGPWPEGKFYRYDQVYASQDMQYSGPRFTFSSIPDQYTLGFYQRTQRATPDHAPVMGEIALLSSHGPWVPVPHLVDWNSLGNGKVFDPMANDGGPADQVWRDRTRIRNAYITTIRYSVSSIISYLQKYGDDNTVLVFLGDHQPAAVVSGENGSHDVPITIVAKDRTVLERVSSWGWTDGLKPGPQSPVWRMDSFRDRFLTAFGPQVHG